MAKMAGLALFVVFAIRSGHAVAKPSARPTFVHDIAPVLQDRCLQCHRPGGIASMAPFTSYEAVKPLAQTIANQVSLHRMPPWPADPAHSLKFSNDPSLTALQIATFRAWADAGAPQGDGAAVDLAAAAAEWHGPGGRKPDLIISMPQAAHIAATGDMPYVRFLAKIPLPADQWIAACQARPGNAAVVHHMAVTEVEIPSGVPPADVDGMERLVHMMGGNASVVRPIITSASKPGLTDMLAIYTPGIALETYPTGTGKLLRGGPDRYLNFNIHYTSNGTAATDRSEVAFWFRSAPAEHQILRSSMSAETILANGIPLEPNAPGEKAEGTLVAIPPIPAGDANYQLTSITGFPQPVTIYQVHPHAHFRAKDFRYVAVYPDGRELTLLTVPDYDFRWQLAYDLETPLRLPAGSKLVVTAHYDNSAHHRFNPGPDQAVYFRAQNMSTDEMFSPFTQFSEETQGSKLPTLEAAGCLTATEPGHWSLSRATLLAAAEPASSVPTVAQGSQTIPLLGLFPFDPDHLRGNKVVVRGLQDDRLKLGLNVTSLHSLATACP